MKQYNQQATMPKPVTERKTGTTVRKKNMQSKVEIPCRRITEPVPIGTLLEPLQKIIGHPDRNRLLAAFFKEDKAGSAVLKNHV